MRLEEVFKNIIFDFKVLPLFMKYISTGINVLSMKYSKSKLIILVNRIDFHIHVDIQGGST